MSEASLKATLQFSEELLCRPPEQRNEEDILRILPWIRHKSSLFKNLEDGKYAEFMLDRLFCCLFLLLFSDHFECYSFEPVLSCRLFMMRQNYCMTRRRELLIKLPFYAGL